MSSCPRRFSILPSVFVILALGLPAARVLAANSRPGRQMIDNLLATGSLHPRAVTSAGRRARIDDDGGWSQLSISGRSGHAAAYDAARDRMLIFGGDDGEFRNDVWALSMTQSPPWKKLQPGGSPPSGRTGARAVVDPVHDRLVIFGGWDSNPNNDVWTLSLSEPGAWQPLAATGTPPDSCGSCNAVYDPVRARLLVLQGSSLWALSLDSNPAWTLIPTSGSYPGDRIYAALEYDPVRDQLVVFGGDDGGWPLPGDAWALTLAGSPQWSLISPAGPAGGRFGATMTYDPAGDRVVVFGGSDGYDFFNDAWALSLSGSPAWSSLNPSSAIPQGRVLHAAVYDSAHQRVVIFGGADDVQSGTDRNDVLALSLGGNPAWSPLPGTSPSPRRAASAIYDAAGNRVIVFGGTSFPGMVMGSNEVWSFSLDADPFWSKLQPSGAPPAPRFGAIATYDPPRQRMLIFGGSGANDLWSLSLDASPAWTPLNAGGLAPPHADAAIHDTHRDRVLIFDESKVWALTLPVSPQWGALDPSGAGPDSVVAAIYDSPRERAVVFSAPPDNDVWELSLSGTPAWGHIDTGPGAPSPRYGPVMVFDPVRDRMVLHGGYWLGELNDSYALSLGSAPLWSTLPSAELGQPRSEHAGVYDSRGDRMIVFGGGNFYVDFNDVWALDWGPTTTTPPVVFSNSLGPGYPNPFNPRVTIPFELRNDGRATLAVYDVSGRLVSTLVNEWTARGAHTAVWNGTTDGGGPVASGVYFCHLRASGFSATRKLVLLK